MARSVPPEMRRIFLAGAALVLLVGSLGFLIGWHLSDRRATEMARAPGPAAPEDDLGDRVTTGRSAVRPQAVPPPGRRENGATPRGREEDADTGRVVRVTQRPRARERRQAKILDVAQMANATRVRRSPTVKGAREVTRSRRAVARPADPRARPSVAEPRPVRPGLQPRDAGPGGGSLAPGRTVTPRRRARAPVVPQIPSIPRAVEPLMVRVLGAYYVVGDEAVRALRDRHWAYGDIAAAGNVAARSGRSLAEVARAFEDHRDWASVAREMGIAPAAVYMALNGPRAVFAGEMAEIDPAGSLDERPRENARPPQPGTSKTAGERVAGARLEYVAPQPAGLLRRAVATYYALPDATVRGLAARGWSLSDLLVAGNLSVRSELSFEQIVAMRGAGDDWREVARRAGVATEEIYQPTIPRRPFARP